MKQYSYFSAYLVYIHASLMPRRQMTNIGRFYIPIQDVWVIWRKEVGVRKAELIENVVSFFGGQVWPRLPHAEHCDAVRSKVP